MPPPPSLPESLDKLKPKTVIFPPCADILLSLIKPIASNEDDGPNFFFQEYFKFKQHKIIVAQTDPPVDITTLGNELHGDLAKLLIPTKTLWPGDCCICSPLVTLDGNRNLPKNQVPPFSLKRLFIGDLAWLFYLERLGTFQILGAILDAYASNGRLPISNGSLPPPPDLGIKDDILAVVLEIMVRQMKMGMSSTVRDRASAYRTSLGWVSDVGRKLDLDTVVNTGFNNLFHKFIFHALEYYKDKRLAVAIQGTIATAKPSVATLITISDTLEIFKKRFEAFDYGRNYYNTLSGIVWAIAGMSVIRELGPTLGIPPAYNDPSEYIPAAYDLLVLKRPVTSGETNRYLVHRECAKYSRDILLDLEVLNHKAINPGEDLETWLNQIEAKVEGYRTAYRTLTGTDLGMAPQSGTPTIEQQA